MKLSYFSILLLTVASSCGKNSSNQTQSPKQLWDNFTAKVNQCKFEYNGILLPNTLGINTLNCASEKNCKEFTACLSPKSDLGMYRYEDLMMTSLYNTVNFCFKQIPDWKSGMGDDKFLIDRYRINIEDFKIKSHDLKIKSHDLKIDEYGLLAKIYNNCIFKSDIDMPPKEISSMSASKCSNYLDCVDEKYLDELIRHSIK